MTMIRRMSWTSKAVLERMVRFEARAATARRAGDPKQEAIWQEAIDTANAILADNKIKAARARIGRDMTDAASVMRRARGVRDYSEEEDAEILAGGPEKFAELGEKMSRSPQSIRIRHYRLTRAPAGLKRSP